VSTIIVNADDYGFSPGTNAAVLHLAQAGAISSTSLMVNMPWVEEIRAVVQACPHLGVGLHVNISQGKPVLDPGEVASLVDARGFFRPPAVLARRAVSGRVVLSEVRREVEAQINRARDLVGDRLDHWDSHQGTHRFEPLASAIMMSCAAAGVPAMRTHRHLFVAPLEADARPAPPAGPRRRLARAVKESYYAWISRRAAAHFVLPDALLAMAGRKTVDVLRCVAAGGAPTGHFEVPCHPATTTGDLHGTTMLQSRVDEYEYLASPQWLEAVRSGRVRLISFAWLVGDAKARGSQNEQLATAAV
jgi:predicted glycoside hydrolase/deacetylase ChbG (UPF0249 family)